MQILVVVANIRARSPSLTDAEKGSTPTSLGRGLVVPKPRDSIPIY